MTLLDRVLLARADEQTSTVRFHASSQERDSWRPANPREVEPAPMRSRCLAGDCAGKVHAAGYCKAHWSRLQRNGTVEDPYPVWSTLMHLRRVLPKANYGRNYRRRVDTRKGVGR